MRLLSKFGLSLRLYGQDSEHIQSQRWVKMLEGKVQEHRMQLHPSGATQAGGAALSYWPPRLRCPHPLRCCPDRRGRAKSSLCGHYNARKKQISINGVKNFRQMKRMLKFMFLIFCHKTTKRKVLSTSSI